MQSYRYSVTYRRDDAPLSRLFHRTVTARDADEARRLVAIVDTHYLATVRSPRRGALVSEAAR